LKDNFHDSELAKKMPCGQTNEEASVKHILALGSVLDFIDVLKDPANSSNFLSVRTDASYHKYRKKFLLVGRYFDHLGEEQ
jgi:hypothetical protein